MFIPKYIIPALLLVQSRALVGRRAMVRTLIMRAKHDKGGDFHGKSLAPLYLPKTANQMRYVEYLNDPTVSIVMGVGPAGTGKTLFACSTAIRELKSGAVSKIILTRPAVSVEEELGFLPGTLMQKMDPWTRPIFDIFLEYYSQKDIDAMVQNGVIEVSPLAYMRGRTFKRSFIIADEMQNSSPNQMLMMTTRLGEGTKMVITGDLKQSDRAVDNGLLDLMNKLRRYEVLMDGNGDGHTHGTGRVCLVEMDIVDVKRSVVVTKILDIYSLGSMKPVDKMNPSVQPYHKGGL